MDEWMDRFLNSHNYYNDITISTSTKQVQDRSLIWNTDLVETLELRNLLGE